MPFNPDLRQHKIETAEYRVDGDYSHAIPAYPEYDSATEFNNAFYQERRDENDRLVGIPVQPIIYTGEIIVSLPDNYNRLTLAIDRSSKQYLDIDIYDIAMADSGVDLDGEAIVPPPGIPTGFSSTVNGNINFVQADASGVLYRYSYELAYRVIDPSTGFSAYVFPSASRPPSEELDRLIIGKEVYVDIDY